LHVIDSISDWLGKIGSFIIVVIILAISWEVVSRYILNQPTLWAHEIAHYSFGVYYVLGAAYAYLYQAHVKMDILYDRFPRRTRAVVDLVITPLLLFSFFGVLLWKGTIMAWKSCAVLETSGSVFNMPIYLFKVVIPIGASLMLLQGVSKFIRDLMSQLRR